MRDYSKISPALWQSSRFNGLPSDDGRYLYLYFLTCSHQNSAGCYRLPDGYACSDLRWQPDRYTSARDQLEAADLIRFDAATSVVMITRWFKHNPPMSESHLTGIERLLERLPADSSGRPLRRPCRSRGTPSRHREQRRPSGSGMPLTGLLKALERYTRRDSTLATSMERDSWEGADTVPTPCRHRVDITETDTETETETDTGPNQDQTKLDARFASSVITPHAARVFGSGKGRFGDLANPPTNRNTEA